MSTLREGIDAVDEEIVRLLDRRAWLARRIGEFKHERGLAAYAPARERAVLDRVAALSEGDFPKRGLEAVFREIISCSISLEARLKVAYLGPEATFTHEAALRSFGTSVELEPQTTVAEVFARVERGEVEHGVVPVENSMEGAVTHTLDEMMDSPLKICGEVYLPVSQNLISGRTLAGQAERRLLPPDGPRPGRGLAQARAPRRAAGGGRVHRRGRPARRGRARGGRGRQRARGGRPRPRGAGRQHTGSPREHDPLYRARTRRGPRGPARTRPAFSSRSRTGPGVLKDALSAFSEEGINLTRIESRPSRKRAWTYVFFADFQGHPEEERVKRALEALEEHCPYVSLVGAYPEVSPETT